MKTSSTDTNYEEIQSECDDMDFVPSSYDLVTYPADFTLEGLTQKLEKAQLLVPGFQRKYVWTIVQASRLIESFLLGLPVPAVFLFTDSEKENRHLVIDGQQRLLSVMYFFTGYFGGADSRGKRTVFRLKGLNEKSPYLGLTYEDLKDADPSAFNRLNDSVLRAFIIKQLNPKGHSSIYHVFERLNTGGTQLVGQEIRNCIFSGSFNDLLIDLNRNSSWRQIVGKRSEDKRMRDVELVLRFFALREWEEKYEKPIKGFLSDYMGAKRMTAAGDLLAKAKLFEAVCDCVVAQLGPKPFHIWAGLNVAVFDSVAVALSRHLDSLPKNIKRRFQGLLKNQEYVSCCRDATTDEKIVRRRIELAEIHLCNDE